MACIFNYRPRCCVSSDLQPLHVDMHEHRPHEQTSLKPSAESVQRKAKMSSNLDSRFEKPELTCSIHLHRELFVRFTSIWLGLKARQ
jgi:hypothetical protein